MVLRALVYRGWDRGYIGTDYRMRLWLPPWKTFMTLCVPLAICICMCMGAAYTHGQGWNPKARAPRFISDMPMHMAGAMHM